MHLSIKGPLVIDGLQWASTTRFNKLFLHLPIRKRKKIQERETLGKFAFHCLADKLSARDMYIDTHSPLADKMDISCSRGKACSYLSVSHDIGC